MCCMKNLYTHTLNHSQTHTHDLKLVQLGEADKTGFGYRGLKSLSGSQLRFFWNIPIDSLK